MNFLFTPGWHLDYGHLPKDSQGLRLWTSDSPPALFRSIVSILGEAEHWLTCRIMEDFPGTLLHTERTGDPQEEDFQLEDSWEILEDF